MSSRRVAILASVLLLFVGIIFFSERVGHLVDGTSDDAQQIGDDKESTTKASRDFGRSSEHDAEAKKMTKVPAVASSSKRQSAFTRVSDMPHLPLPDFRLSSDQPDATFLRVKLHFQVRDENSNSPKFPLPISVTFLRQLHHGIYECRGTIPGDAAESHQEQQQQQEVVFAFKTECRPESKWHGQQGYPEILTNWLVETMFGEQFIGSFTPGAIGGVIRLSDKLMQQLHKDGCGLLTEHQVKTLYGGGSSASASSSSSALRALSLAAGERVVIGAALQWKPMHNDDAIPGVAVLEPFRVIPLNRDGDNDEARKWKDGEQQQKQQGKKSASSTAGRLPDLPLPSVANKQAMSVATVLQISDIFTVDYIMGNEDRLDKNWFKDDKQRFIAMDNGWALAGFNYDGSTCDLDEDNLKCPPLMRRLAGAKRCNKELVVNCRFRRGTVNSVKRLIQVLEADSKTKKDGDGKKNFPFSESSNGLEARFRRDPLLVFLTRFYNTLELRNTRKNDQGNKTRRPWSNALARYVAGCPLATSRRAADETAMTLSEVAQMVNAGLLQRAKKLLGHVESCSERYLERAVLFD